MTEPIEFESNENHMLWSILPNAVSGGLPKSYGHPTTDEEFDIVARRMGYVKDNASPMADAIRDQLDILCEGGENRLATLLRIIRERNVTKCKDECNNCGNVIDGDSAATSDVCYDCWKAATSHTCHIDGVEYQGNEETIGKLRQLKNDCDDYWNWRCKFMEVTGVENWQSDDALVRAITDLKRRLVEAKERIEYVRHQRDEADASAVPEKWRKAIEKVLLYTQHKEATPVGAMYSLIRGFNEKSWMFVSSGVASCLNWLAAELEKSGREDGG